MIAQIIIFPEVILWITFDELKQIYLLIDKSCLSVKKSYVD